jgi:hypothetical protein
MMYEPPIDETGHKGGEEEMLTLAQENVMLRKRIWELETLILEFGRAIRQATEVEPPDGE